MAKFGQVWPCDGVDEHTAAGHVGIIVPLRGSNNVILMDGSALKVSSTRSPAVQVQEIDDPHAHPIWADLVVAALAIGKLKVGAIRVFKVTGNSLVGIDVAEIRATNAHTSKVEATLKVIVLRQKLIRISIRPVQIHDELGHVLSFTNAPVDARKLLDQMNAVWEPQANVVFDLGKTDPALIDGLSPKAIGADIQNPTLLASFMSKKDPAADFTAFLVRRALDGNSQVSGVTNSEAGFALISDDRSDRTLAHEAGHFLGSLNAHGKFSHRYGDRGLDPDLLMRGGGAGRKIPFGLVTDFNKGYR
ncbi:MAG: hypothetical protein ACRD51_00160 [Candidatus Acidiferrum sp.]